MENLKDLFNYFYELLKPILLIGLMVVGILVLFNALVFFAIEIDKSKIDKMKYCPSCGVDLIYNS